MSSLVYRVSKLGLLMGDLAASSAGCFAFMHGFRLIAMGAAGEEGSDTGSSMRADRRSPKPLAGIGAALFLLAFAGSEVLETIGTIRHRSRFATLAH
jgi:hypothetical protein